MRPVSGRPRTAIALILDLLVHLRNKESGAALGAANITYLGNSTMSKINQNAHTSATTSTHMPSAAYLEKPLDLAGADVGVALPENCRHLTKSPSKRCKLLAPAPWQTTSGGLFDKSRPRETGNQLKQALAPSRNPKLSGQPILAPCFFEMLSFRLINATRTASCMTILFVMELSKHGHDWVRGADIWRALDPEREFMLQRILKFAPILGCLEVERRASNNGNMHHFFRLKDEVQFVDCNGISGRLMTWMLASLTSINCARPKQTPRIGLLLFAIFAKKLVKRTDIDEYLENKNENASVILRHIDVLCELNFIIQHKTFRGNTSSHFVRPISSSERAL